MKVNGNQLILRKESLEEQQTISLRYDASLGYGSWVLEGGEGELITEVYETALPFNDLVASWNTETPVGTYAEIFGRLYVEGRGWSKWLSWGPWSTRISRRCDNDEDEIAYSNAYRDGGDSSINTKDGKTATKFQLKAVLHAREDSKAQPSIRLLAATWKDTTDPDWTEKCTYAEETVPEKEKVLLSCPAISQIRRDPSYGGVICSATSMTMMLNHFGETMTPEEMTMVNYDHGFGGNGNWSFTAAAGGAYGYESYCSYSSFAAVRQELSKGNVVGFSVKYSRNTDSDVPYMENTYITTHGHLITIIGYYFNKELGEYVYYCNDPAGCNDYSVGPREHRESQLSQAWYRRMIYIAHGPKLPGCGTHACEHIEAKLVPAGPQGAYDMVTPEGTYTFGREFLKKKCDKFGGHGSIGWYSESEPTELTPTQKRVVSNHTFHFEGIFISQDGKLCFEFDWPAVRAARGEKVHLMVFDNTGKTYHAMF